MSIENLLTQCGFSKRHRGFWVLRDCVFLALEDDRRLIAITGLYKEVSCSFQISWMGVEKNIRTALDYAWENSGDRQMEFLFGECFYNKPTPGELIELLANYLRMHSECCAYEASG